MISVESRPTFTFVGEKPQSEKNEDAKLPVIKVYKDQRALTINGRQINFSPGTRWEFMLRLFEGSITKPGVRNFLRERDQYSLTETFIRNIRVRIEPDPLNPTLLIESKIDNESVYTLNARIEIAGPNDLLKKRSINIKKTNTKTGPADKEEDEKNLPASSPPFSEFFFQ